MAKQSTCGALESSYLSCLVGIHIFYSNHFCSLHTIPSAPSNHNPFHSTSSPFTALRYAPFEEDPKGKAGAEPLFEKIKKAKYSFDARYWKAISEDAKDLIRTLLVVDPTKRLTAEQALAHPWMAKYHEDSNPSAAASSPSPVAASTTPSDAASPATSSTPITPTKTAATADPKPSADVLSSTPTTPTPTSTPTPISSRRKRAIATTTTTASEHADDHDDDNDQPKAKKKKRALDQDKDEDEDEDENKDKDKDEDEDADEENRNKKAKKAKPASKKKPAAKKAKAKATVKKGKKT